MQTLKEKDYANLYTLVNLLPFILIVSAIVQLSRSLI